MLKAVIFDMDGVIIDSEPIYLKVNQKLFLQYNLNISNEEYTSFIGLSNPETWSLIKDKYHLPQTVQELVARQHEGNIDYFRQSNEKPIPGIVNLLESLTAKRISIGLASSSPLAIIDLVLERLKVAKFFQIVVSGEDLAHSKPAPDIFLRASQLLDVEPRHCLVIEDSKNGVKAAKAAGMKCIGFQNVNSYNQDLSEAVLIVDNLESLDINQLENICSD